jgi:hypothetical protein
MIIKMLKKLPLYISDKIPICSFTSLVSNLHTKYLYSKTSNQEVAHKYGELIANTDCAILLGKLDEKRHEMAKKIPKFTSVRIIFQLS